MEVLEMRRQRCLEGPARKVVLTALALVLVIGSAPVAAQQTQQADPQAESTTACRKEVRSRVHQSHPQARDFQIHRGKIEQWQKSNHEIGFSGDGRVQLRSGEWKDFRFTCTYNTRHSRVTGADVQMQGDSGTTSSSGSASNESPGQQSWGGGAAPGSSLTTSSNPPDFGITLYRDLNLRGVSQTFTDDVADLRGSRIGDDQATSVAVRGGCRARLHRDPHFRGGFIEIGADVVDLRRTGMGDDTATSIEVRCNSSRSWSGQGGASPGGGWGSDSGSTWGGSGGDAPYGVTLYRDPHFSGLSETFTGDVSDLWDSRIGNDEATSVRLSRGCRARLYRDGNYQGNYVEIDSDIPDLRSSPVGDDSISSMHIRCERDQWGDEWSGGGGTTSYGVTLHRDPHFSGISATFTEDVRNLDGSRFGNDQATSVSIGRGCRARLYQDADFRGSYIEISSDVADLRGSRVGDDSISSLQVRCDR